MRTEEIKELLIQKNSMLDAIIESSPDVIVFALDKEYKYISYNENHKKTMKQIWGKDISTGINMLEVISLEADRKNAKTNFDRALTGESFVLEEVYGDDKLSRLYWVDYYSPLILPDGSVIGLTCFVLNNTKQRQAEEKVKMLLEEKTLILKEVHHRIKNNMNITYSLLKLQSESQTDDRARSILNNAAVRIQSMMVLYEKLYQSENFLDISLKTYIDSLMAEIENIISKEKPITIKTEIDDISLDANIASNIGIIINELSTNSIKHAFKDQCDCEIHMKITQKENMVYIEYFDNGIGIPQNIFTGSNSGFGITLVKMLSNQLKAAVEVRDGPGANIKLAFAV